MTGEENTLNNNLFNSISRWAFTTWPHCFLHARNDGSFHAARVLPTRVEEFCAFLPIRPFLPILVYFNTLHRVSFVSPFCDESCAPKPNPLSFHLPFLTEKVALTYTFDEKINGTRFPYQRKGYGIFYFFFRLFFSNELTLTAH